MSTSANSFDENQFRQDAIDAFSAENLLDWLIDTDNLRGSDTFSCVCGVLDRLHNEGEIDLLSSFEALGQRPNAHEFWLLQDLFSRLAPALEVQTDRLMSVVTRLVKLGGGDMMANEPNRAFREWLKAHPSETLQLLEEAKKGSLSEPSLLTFVLEAGAIQQPEFYQDASIQMLSSERESDRKAAVIALGRISNFSDDSHNTALSSLIEFARTTSNEEDRAGATSSALSMHARKPYLLASNVLDFVNEMAQWPSPPMHYGLANSLSAHAKVFSIELQKAIITALQQADPSMKGIIEQIDFAFSQSISDETKETISIFLESFFQRSQGSASLDDFPSFNGALHTKFEPILIWIAIRWLRFGNHQTRCQLPVLLRNHLEQDQELEVSLESFQFSDEELLFVCRKALGYLLIEAAAASSILIACLRECKTEGHASSIAELLFDPLMINYSGVARSVVEAHAIKAFPRFQQLSAALKRHDEYIKGLKSVGRIPELSPAPSSQQLQSELQRQNFAASFKEAEKQSSLLQLVTRQTLLFGRGSAHYLRLDDGSFRRSVSYMSSHGHSIEFPRLETLDPVSFQNRILLYRTEQMQE